MQNLDREIICHECKTSHTTVPDEDESDAPVHCAECGAFMCLWGDVVTSNELAMKKA
ncbi:hypothetical protein [Phyllobacterium sp. YR531]|uniref:hypothetical protein n=1 Tax=Phyllobacterium sp. YR531 TaxID=1144343 RepID=UPI00026F8F8C|nr:hypothetical protein [Phyllobacterium sp. YR531]EJN06085.1 hypothetical protein PMI41_00480 [Phyllobacterium sp. YR531]